METFCDICSAAHLTTHDDSVLFGDPPRGNRAAVPESDPRIDSLIPIDVEKRIREEWMGEERPA